MGKHNTEKMVQHLGCNPQIRNGAYCNSIACARLRSKQQLQGAVPKGDHVRGELGLLGVQIPAQTGLLGLLPRAAALRIPVIAVPPPVMREVPGKAKVGNLEPPVVVEEDVGGLEVTDIAPWSIAATLSGVGK